MRQGRQGKRTDRDVREAIEHLALEGESPTTIANMLAADAHLAARAPGIRTIRSIASEALRGDPSGTWTIADAPADELVAVLPVLGWLIENFARNYVTVAEASIITRLSAYAPELGPGSMWAIAHDVQEGA